MHHKLKCHPAMFRAVRDGSKKFEARFDDRAFQCGDTVELLFHDPAPSTTFPVPPAPHDPKDSLDPLFATIGFVLRGGQYGVEPGHVVFSLIDVGQGVR